MRDGYLYLESDRLIKLNGLQDQSADGDYINDATVTFTLRDGKKDAGGSPVSGAENLPALYITGSNGNYEVIIPYSVSLTRGTTYWGYVKAVKDTTQWMMELELDADYL